ncbi:MAG: HEPN domain-containing protein [Anaerolineae bacterium]|nr:HEPN domain-containing protein [Anaerolineae bacterium]MCB9102888.1 HEPN domain-containing protein [Anaerolineales bacterium]
MKNKADLVKGWLAKAQSDLNAADILLDSAGPYDMVCYHAQQAIEKLLKGFLAFLETAIPRTHDLEELQRLCLESKSVVELTEIDLAQITDYVVSARYDFEFWPDQTTAAEALNVAEQVQAIIIKNLPEGYR